MERSYRRRMLAAYALEAAADFLTVDGLRAPLVDVLEAGAELLDPGLEVEELPGAFWPLEGREPSFKALEPEPAATAPPAPARSICLKCGEPAQREWSFCPRCGGTSFLEAEEIHE